MTVRTSSQVERDLVRLCHSGLDVPAMREGVLRSLRQLMPVDAAFFATADPETLLFTDAFVEEPLAASTPAFLSNEFGSNDVNKFAALATARQHVASLDDATRGDRPSSGRYRDIMRPLELGDELRAALVVDSTCWGYLCLHRTDHPLGFTAQESALIARLGPHIARALRQAVLLHAASEDGASQPPGVVLLSDELDLVAVTPEAEHLLSMVAADRSRALPLPVAVYTAAAALRAVEHGSARAGEHPSVRVRTAHGLWLNLHASRLHGPPNAGTVAVIVEPAQPRAAIPMLLSAYRLSPREAEVLRLVLRGESTQAISNALHISAYTVQDHLKTIFDKVGVRSRRELVGRLLAGGSGHSANPD